MFFRITENIEALEAQIAEAKEQFYETEEKHLLLEQALLQFGYR